MRRTTRVRPADVPSGTVDAEPEGTWRSQVQALLRSGLLDVEYYAAASGELFPDRRSAARHFVAVGMAEGLTPTPLLSLGHLPKPVRKAWRKGQVRRVLDHLAAPEQRRAVVGPLFDSGAYVDSLPAGTDLDGLSPLGHFLLHAGPDTPLPLPERNHDDPRQALPTLAEAHDALADHASLVEAQERDRSGRELSFHDAAPVPDGRPAQLWRESPGGPLLTILTPWQENAVARSTAVLMAQEQTLHRWELVFAGPDVPDETSFDDGRVRAVRSGPDVDWRNRGLAAAEAPYVAFLLPGHWWRPDFLEAALKRLITTHRESGHAAVLLHDSAGRAAVQPANGDLAWLRSAGHVDLGVLVSATAAAREVGGFDASLGAGAAPAFAIRLAERGPSDEFPFVASDRLSLAMPLRHATAAGADGAWLAVLGRAWVDWEQVRVGLPDRVPGRVSAVIPTFNDAAMTIRAVRSLLATTSVPDLEVNIVDNGSTMEVGQDLIAAFLGDARVRYRRLPVNLNFAIASNVGFAQATGEVVLFLNNDTVSEADWVPGVVAHLADPEVAGAQPLLLYPDGEVQTAGTIFPVAEGLACHFLVGRTPEEVQAVGTLRFSAATAAALAMRAVDVAALEGFDAHYVNGMEDVDLCLRALALRPGGFRVEPASPLTHLEGKSAGRSRRIPQNRLFFMERWRGRLPGPEAGKYAEVGFRLLDVLYDDVAVPTPRPVIEPA